ncbi:hypothetical protein FGO68_gene2792 [Halteria grandinella]|uniref:Peptidase A1 domain-containing protein n=1 Tax=Halteria grandinella TaxID=5974 RepID=A0A8J8NQH3_HALGN|nr:hypothetical protein FGO68_gene2792 [Halteria grandinella]
MKLITLSLLLSITYQKHVDFSLHREPIKKANNHPIVLSTEQDVVDKAIESMEQSINFYTDIYIGSGRQRFKAILDTNISPIIVALTDCDQCVNNTQFAYLNSSTAGFFDPLRGQTYLPRDDYYPTYTQSTYQGSYLTDDVCLSENVCAKNYSIFGIVEGPAITDADGVLGLRPGPGPIDNSSFMEHLVEQGVIGSSMFGLYVSPDVTKSVSSESKIRFGGIDQDLKDDKLFSDDVSYFSLIQLDTWHLRLYSATFGGKSIFNGLASTVEFNPSTPFIAVTPSHFEQIAKTVQSEETGMKCYNNQACVRMGDCKVYEGVKVTFKIGDSDAEGAQEFEIDARNLMVSSKDLDSMAFKIGDYEEYCVLGIIGTVPESSKKYVMGNLFLSNFYTLFDADHQRIGFSIKLTEKPILTKSLFIWFGIAAGVLLVLIIGIKVWKRKKESDLQKKLDSMAELL